MNRSAAEVKARCSCILENECITSLVIASSSPTAAYEMIFAETKDVAKSKGGRWLAVLRRDYPIEFSNLTLSTTNHAGNGTVIQGGTT